MDARGQWLESMLTKFNRVHIAINIALGKSSHTVALVIISTGNIDLTGHRIEEEHFEWL